MDVCKEAVWAMPAMRTADCMDLDHGPPILINSGGEPGFYREDLMVGHDKAGGYARYRKTAGALTHVHGRTACGVGCGKGSRSCPWKDFKFMRQRFVIHMCQRARHGIRRQDTAKDGDCVLGMPRACEHGAMTAVAKHDVAGSEAE